MCLKHDLEMSAQGLGFTFVTWKSLLEHGKDELVLILSTPTPSVNGWMDEWMLVQSSATDPPGFLGPGTSTSAPHWEKTVTTAHLEVTWSILPVAHRAKVSVLQV